MNPDTTVFLIDDDASVRKGLKRLLHSSGYFVEAFESAEAFLNNSIPAGAGCVILDLRMPGVSGIELQQQLDTLNCKLPIIFLSGHAGISDSVQAMKYGAVDFLTKPVDEKSLLASIDAAIDHQRQQLVVTSENDSFRQRVASLTGRELETLQWVISGLRNKQIAAKLGITEKTVKVHRARILEKTATSSVAELVRLCTLTGIHPKTHTNDSAIIPS
ncbi:MAG: response regulator [Gammaproteobacteria bacterium]|jgi:FixJ family two-component response regulator